MTRRPYVLAVGAAIAVLLAGVGALALLPRQAVERHAPTSVKAGGREIFVAPGGSDDAKGTREAPLETITAAVSSAEGGDVVRVRKGTYDERVEFSGDGTSERPITFEAYGDEAVTIARGFRVTGDYNVIRGFAVTPGESDPAVFEPEESQDSFLPQTTGQIQVVGSHNTLERISHHDEKGTTPDGVSALAFLGGSHNTVRDIDFHHCHPVCFAGNERERPGSGTHNTVSGGTIHHTDRSFVTISADDATLEGLDMHDSGQVDRDSGDSDAADGINLDGARITIRDCAIHRVFSQTPEQHTDAIQWWGAADDLVIEDNVIGSAARGGEMGQRDQGHIQWTSETQGKSSRRVIVRNNVFLGSEVPYAVNGSPQQTIPGQADEWRIVGNTFVSAESIRPDLLQAATGWVVADNVFHTAAAFEQAASGNRVSNNCYVGFDPPAGESDGSFRTEDARFADPDLSAATRFGVDADWRPLASSPLGGGGVALEELPRDMVGARRPDPPTIGALEAEGR